MSQKDVPEIVVEDGDSLYSIAKRLTGDGDKWPELWRLNDHAMRSGGDPHLIFPGERLQTPRAWRRETSNG